MTQRLRRWTSRMTLPVLLLDPRAALGISGRAAGHPAADAGGSRPRSGRHGPGPRAKSSSKTRSVSSGKWSSNSRRGSRSSRDAFRRGPRPSDPRPGLAAGRAARRAGRDRGRGRPCGGPGGLARHLRVFGRIGGAARTARTQADRPLQHAGPGPGPAGHASTSGRDSRSRPTTASSSSSSTT